MFRKNFCNPAKIKIVSCRPRHSAISSVGFQGQLKARLDRPAPLDYKIMPGLSVGSRRAFRRITFTKSSPVSGQLGLWHANADGTFHVGADTLSPPRRLNYRNLKDALRLIGLTTSVDTAVLLSCRKTILIYEASTTSSSQAVTHRTLPRQREREGPQRHRVDHSRHILRALHQPRRHESKL